MNIENEAAWFGLSCEAQELLRGREGLRDQSHRPEQAPQGPAHRLVVVDDEDGRPSPGHEILALQRHLRKRAPLLLRGDVSNLAARCYWPLVQYGRMELRA